MMENEGNWREEYVNGFDGVPRLRWVPGNWDESRLKGRKKGPSGTKTNTVKRFNYLSCLAWWLLSRHWMCIARWKERESGVRRIEMCAQRSNNFPITMSGISCQKLVTDECIPSTSICIKWQISIILIAQTVFPRIFIIQLIQWNDFSYFG